MVIDDGVIKYDNSSFTQTGALEQDEIQEIEKYRLLMYQKNLIGEYVPEKIGFGNISQRKDYSKILKHNRSQFVISGSQTGHLENLTGSHYSRVIDFDLQKNLIVASGPINASSESLTHAAIYECSKEIQAIIHIHHLKIWEEMMKADYDFTHQDIPYGTPEMAKATMECIGDKTKGIFVMKGHHEGVVAYGESFHQANDLILEVFQKFTS